MEFELDDHEVPNGTILVIGAQYRENPKVWTYAALKAGGRWYFTGMGKVPQDAGWGAVKRWLADNSRRIVSVRVVTATDELWPHTNAPTAGWLASAAALANEPPPDRS